MVTITTERATISRWNDVQHALSGGGDGHSCQCVWPVLRSTDWRASSFEERQHVFHDEIEVGPPPGLIAYVDGEAAGWIRVGPRTAQRRIIRTKAIAAVTPEALGDPSVWAVACFVVRKEHRGRGLNAQLLDAALTYAAESGARVVEAYVVDTSSGSQHPNGLFHGTLSTFLKAGFTHGPSIGTGSVLVTRQLAA